MTDGLNRVTLLGNLGQDPELRITPGGQSVLKLSLGCNESYLDRNNVRQERVEWVRCSLWGKRAEGLAKHLAKGDRICVEGKLHTSSYEKNGEKRYSTEVTVLNVVFCGSRREGGSEGGGQQRSGGGGGGGRRAAAPQEFGPDVGSPPAGDDDIPF